MTLPHSITTWSLTGLSLSATNGLCLVDHPTRIKTFQPIFLQISLPYTVIQNEQIEMIATVFNYDTVRKSVLLYMYGLEDLCSEAEEAGQKSTRKHLIVDANSANSVTFPMVPLKTGTYDLKVVALWPTSGSDVVVKTLTVIAPGVPVEDDFTFQLDPLNRNRRQKRQVQTHRMKDFIDPGKFFTKFCKCRLILYLFDRKWYTEI